MDIADRVRACLAGFPLLGALALGASGPAGAAAGVDGGAFHNCAADSAGSAYCWGKNTNGQIGDGLILTTIKLDVAGLSGATNVEAGYFHTCAVTAGGGVSCWGENTAGQLGDGTRSTRTTPAPVSGLTGAVSLSLGERFSCALTSTGGVRCWGQNVWGHLGDGTTEMRLVPSSVVGLSSGVTAIATGEHHACALTAARRVKCWGRNANGQLGDGTTTDRTSPVDVPGLPDSIAIAAGHLYSCAVDVSGGVRCWGSNSNFQLGDGTTTQRNTPVAVSGLSAGVRQVALANGKACALTTQGSVLCWGNFGGPFVAPAIVTGLGSGVSSMAAGQYHFCGVVGSGMRCWQGNNVVGELGDGTTSPTAGSVAVVGLPASVTGIGLGTFYSCALLATGGVRCWGDNFYGQLGADYPNEYNLARRVSGLTGVIEVSSGAKHSCAVLSSGLARCWGANESGQLGDGTRNDRGLPSAVIGSGYRSISAGAGFTCALTNAGGVQCWGSGALGNGSSSSNIPVNVTGLGSGVAALATGSGHACALLVSGAVFCWGSNFSGQVGAGAGSNFGTPVPVTGLGSGVTAISAGATHTCALLAAGTLKCWGSNTYGTVGDGTTTNRFVPVDVTITADRFRAISAGYTSTCAVTTSGALRCWGEFAENIFRAPRHRAILVPGLGDRVVAVTQGDSHACAYLEGGGVSCFGANNQVQLGDGTKVGSRKLAQAVVGSDGRSFLDLTPENPLAAERLPPFVVVASGSGTNVTASISYRPQDVGTTGSVYVFALAPANVASPAANGEPALEVGKAVSKSGAKEETAVACVLAQLNTSGQLQAVSASSLQAYVTGVLGAQGASVAVLSATSTVSIGGTTFYVGYGTSASAMLNGGLNRSVVSVPGSQECKPQPPQTGWWWNKDEGGRGYSIEVQGRNIFYAAFLYDASGRSKWHVATGQTSLDGSLFTGDLLEVRAGQTLFGAYVPPSPVTSVGPLTLAFNDDTFGTMVWPGGTVAIERFAINPNGLTAPEQPGIPENGWWWNPAESGRGFFIEWQNGAADLAGYMYDEQGNPVWYLAVYPTPDPMAFSGNWWTYANGQTLTGAYQPATQTSNSFAPVSIQFHSRESATLNLPGGRTTALVRHRF